MATFLSEDHFDAAREALNSDPAFLSSIANVDLAVQFDVTGAPEGEVSYYLKVADGAATTALGPLDGSDVTVSSDYETSQTISKGELNVQMAFMTGKIKVGGNMAKIMMHQSVLNEYTRVLSGLDIEY
ncbi:MAG: SCP2 sterol-binding domain-containing protein [Actinomycetota bacterium]|nr:SCP2 sterol-binding domain-containing protein [Actinomycetota bacterium]MDK1016588.1 SCP2 sterol-binding domain-containing protein [Actinomycetota bacterium]MDK1026364.1 SCP2 sterol-binding domain-containing protein [Actinomycetota bacterium]MDK1038788.1 SCP2 sterol-binding domain-containing protein [Actinomycetota bacterium]MDK1096307.1 SCP2 sterol-binding domain-containing protein [Actinomycetota bacterium]